ncbi:MAG TPA: hypothetical protein VK907_09365 [Phnomibacter sp.]|nr:hypothetical protein [Phnomibacter sp.]
MYHLVYVPLYLLSLLPFRAIYWLSDGICFLLYHVFRYRREMVFDHLKQAFPGKTEKEIGQIAKKFYRNFSDTWVEMIKVFSMTPAQAQRRIECDFSIVEKWHKEGKSVQVVGGHFMNWEYLPVAVPLFQPFVALAIYMPVSNKVMDRIVFDLRSRFGMVLLRAGRMQEEMKPWHEKQYLMVVGADQSPSDPSNAYWLNFCNRPTGFIRGPWQRAVKDAQPYAFFHIQKLRRGYYKFSMEAFEEQPRGKDPATLAMKYAKMLEADIKANPDLYLWSHKRWKKPWKAEYIPLWVDGTPPPMSN